MPSTFPYEKYCVQYFMKPKDHKVFLVGLPKCGTASFHHLFQYLGYKSIHHKVNRQPLYTGHIMKANHANGKPLVSGEVLEKYQAFSQLDSAENDDFVCPQRDMLVQLIQENPTAYFILNTRDIDKHIASVMNWDGQSKVRTLDRLGIVPMTLSEAENVRAMGDWIEGHNQYVRTVFTEQFPNVKFMEVRIDDPKINETLRDFFGCSKLFFPHSNMTRVSHRERISYAEAKKLTASPTKAPSVAKSSTEASASLNVTPPSAIQPKTPTLSAVQAKKATTTTTPSPVNNQMKRKKPTISGDAPIFVLGLVGSKDEILCRVFEKHGIPYVNRSMYNGAVSLGRLMNQNLHHHRKALESSPLRPFHAFMGLDCMEDAKGASVWPQFSFLGELMKQYPDAHFILNRRDVTEHAESLMNDVNALGQPYTEIVLKYDVPYFHHDGRVFALYFERWLHAFYGVVQNVFESDKDVHFLDVDMDAPNAANVIEQFLGL